jgi:hypothetical protein
MGGVSPFPTLNSTVEQATINADATLSPINVSGVKLAIPRYTASSAVVANSIYMIDGFDGSGASTTLEMATLAPDSSLTSFSAVGGVSLSVGRSRNTSVVVGDSIYVIGGLTTTGSVLASVERVSSKGTLTRACKRVFRRSDPLRALRR